ncbi:MAG: hypothetical protein QM784_06390 [Polyangiaceae bacterium]
MGTVGLPPDAVAWVALGLAGTLGVLARCPSSKLRRLTRFFETHYGLAVFALSVLAALLSLGYVQHYLRGGSRIIDATTYLLEARGFASGHFGVETLPVSASQRGRFLYFAPETRHLSALFPPGYPAILALGVAVGRPVVIGAALAMLLVWTTALLTHRIFASRRAALFAASLSVTNACLRYHTADTMSHGLAALLVVLSLYGGLGTTKRDGTIAGLSLGWLFATRPATALGIGFVIAVHLLWCTKARGFVVAFLPSLLPGLVLWWLYQWASTGAPLGSTQMAYYAVADGPRGCFRYGFGKGIGCLFEHGTYVAHRLPNGYGPWQAAYVTLLRLRWHALDVLGFELIAPLAVWSLTRSLKRRDDTRAGGPKFVALAILAVIVAYVPFYFDGSYPGGGARFYADVIPLEHALIAGVFLSTPLALWILPHPSSALPCTARSNICPCVIATVGAPCSSQRCSSNMASRRAWYSSTRITVSLWDMIHARVIRGVKWSSYGDTRTLMIDWSGSASDAPMRTITSSIRV